MSPRLGFLLALLSLAVVPACSSAPQCVIDTDCTTIGEYCTNPPGGAGGTCVPRGSGGHDTGPRVDSGPVTDSGPPRDSGPDTGPAMDTGPAIDTGPLPDTGAHDTGVSADVGRDAPG